MMRATVGALFAAAMVLATASMPDALAQGRAGDEVQVPSAGNWSRAKSVDEARGTAGQPAKGAKKSASTGSQGDVPIPRPKPGSKAAKADAKAAEEKAAKAEKAAKTKNAAKADDEPAGEPADKKKTAAVPAPRAKPEEKKPVEAGLPTAGADSNAPYRGNLDKEEIKSVLSGRTVLARVDGKDARITLADDGRLSWNASGGSANGFWWTEKGRMCDRFDPSGDFPGRGAGCRSFEQRGGEYYAGGKPINFAN